MDDEEEERLEEIKEQYKLTDDEVLEYREAFTLFDKDEDGLVTVKDLGTVFRCLGRYPTQTEIRVFQNAFCFLCLFKILRRKFSLLYHFDE